MDTKLPALNYNLEPETISKYNIKNEADFMKAFQIAVRMSQGDSKEQAAISVGMNKRTLYTDRWKEMIATAQIILREDSVSSAKSAITQVQSKWPEIIARMIKISLQGSDRDAVEAAKMLQEHYITPFVGEDADQSEASAFLKRKPNFNPTASILDAVRAGGVKMTLEPSARDEIEVIDD